MSTIAINRSSPTPLPVVNEPFNYIVGLQKLAAVILAAMSRISSNDQQSIQLIQKRFMDASLKGASLQSNAGKVEFITNTIAFAVFGASLFSQNADDREGGRIIAEKLIPSLGGILTAKTQGNMQIENAKSMKEMKMWEDKTAGQQNNAGARQDIGELQRSLRELETSASRAN